MRLHVKIAPIAYQTVIVVDVFGGLSREGVDEFLEVFMETSMTQAGDV